MLTPEAFRVWVRGGVRLLDGATGSNLMKAGMPKGACTEQWVLEHPDTLVRLQSAYARAGSNLIYAPTFQAQPIALKRVGLAQQTEDINAKLVQLTRTAAPEALVAGDLTTLAAYLDSFDPENFDEMVENYACQIRGLLKGGADLLAAETLLYPLEAEAILTAAEMEGASCCMYTFTMQPDGALFSGADAGPVLRDLEDAGACAVGFNCVAADEQTPALVARLRRSIRGPLVCKPNAGSPVIGMDGLPTYPMDKTAFARIAADCAAMGAGLLGGCCGTDPEFILELRKRLDKMGI